MICVGQVHAMIYMALRVVRRILFRAMISMSFVVMTCADLAMIYILFLVMTCGAHLPGMMYAVHLLGMTSVVHLFVKICEVQRMYWPEMRVGQGLCIEMRKVLVCFVMIPEVGRVDFERVLGSLSMDILGRKFAIVLEVPEMKDIDLHSDLSPLVNLPTKHIDVNRAHLMIRSTEETNQETA